MGNLSKTTAKAAQPAKTAIDAGPEKAQPGQTAPLGAKIPARVKTPEPGLAEKAMSTSARKTAIHSMSSEACATVAAKSTAGAKPKLAPRA